MQRIIDSLHCKYSDMPNLRAREVRVDKQLRKVFCALSYPNLPDVDKALQNDIIAYVKTLVPQGYTAAVTFANDHFTAMGFKKFLTDFLKRKYPLFSVIVQGMEVSVTDDSAKAVFHVNATMQRNIEIAELTDKITDYLAEYTCYNVSFGVVLDKDATVIADLSEQERLVHLAVNRELLKPSRYFVLTDVKMLLGSKKVKGLPTYISDIRKASDSCVLCGVVSGKTLKTAKNNNTMYVCKFTLTDQSGASVNCVKFTRTEITDVEVIKQTMGKTDSEAKTMSSTRSLANDGKLEKLNKLHDGMEVVVRGAITFNKYSEQLEMIVTDLSTCKIQSIGNAIEYNLPVAEDYVTVIPETYNEYMQASFVHQLIGKSLLSDKTYAVLHVNATGYNVTKDKIIAICAVKIVDGHVTEKFFTYINPESSVTDAALSSAQTTTSKIVISPIISEVISDLYKFTYQLPLVGADIPQILDLINYYASPVGYKFTNESVAERDMLSNLFDSSAYLKKPNCSKLEDVARICKVPCTDVKFCGSSAMTVAKCMVAIANNVK